MKTILITGSTDGIGKETAKQLAKKGHRIIIHGRNQDKAQNVKKELNSINPEAAHQITIADLGSQKGVSGNYFVNKRKKNPVATAYSQELQDHLWKKSIEMIRYQEIINKIDDCFLNFK